MEKAYKNEEKLRNIIRKGFWGFEPNVQKGMLKALQKEILHSPKELANTDVILDENGNLVTISIPKKYDLVIQSKGEDSIYEVENYGVDVNAKKTYQIQEIKYKAPDGYFIVSPKGIIECKKTLTRFFDLTSPRNVVTVIRNEDELNRLGEAYVKIANRRELEDQAQILLDSMEDSVNIINEYDVEKRGITIKQSVILEDGKLSLLEEIYDPYGLIESLESYEYDKDNKCFIRGEELSLYSILDFNLVLQDINDNLGTDLKGDDDYPTTPFRFLCLDKNKLDNLLKLYEVSQGISFYNNSNEIGISEKCFVVDRPRSYKPKKKREQR